MKDFPINPLTFLKSSFEDDYAVTAEVFQKTFFATSAYIKLTQKTHESGNLPLKIEDVEKLKMDILCNYGPGFTFLMTGFPSTILIVVESEREFDLLAGEPIFCECCKNDINGKNGRPRMDFSVNKHILNIADGNLSYHIAMVDGVSVPISSMQCYVKLCALCYNEIALAAIDKFKKMQGQFKQECSL